MNWTQEQLDIFRHFAGGKNHIAMEALAGTAKTTSLLEGIARAPDVSALICAFNKRIQEELEGKIAKLPRKGVVARTFHALGLQVLRRHWPATAINERRTEQLTRRVAAGQPYKVLKSIIETVYKVKETQPFADDTDTVTEVAITFGTIRPDVDVPDEDLAQLVLAVLDEARKPSGEIDFSDMVWLPIVHRWDMPFRYKLVVVDEAQDVSPVQLMLAKKMFVDRMAFAFDRNQSIYGWRGADGFNLDELANELGAVRLPLTTTFRCSRAVVVEANRIVPTLKARPDAPEGLVQTIPWAHLDPEPGSFVLSRTNAPLVETCLALRNRGVDARIEGRETLEYLLGVFEHITQTTSSGVGFTNGTQDWCAREVASAQQAASPNREARAIDTTKTLLTLFTHEGNAAKIPSALRSLYQPSSGDLVTCSTVHKAKGLEADNVYMLRETLPQFRADIPPETVDPENYRIQYVAVTRARHNFFWVTRPEGW